MELDLGVQNFIETFECGNLAEEINKWITNSMFPGANPENIGFLVIGKKNLFFFFIKVDWIIKQET